MAVTRPLKEGSVTTYQQKVALGFPDILASEMDADLDTIYAAWNGNVGTANLVDGSVTYAKLAPDAQLWRDTGTTLVPGTSFATRPVATTATPALQWGANTWKGRMIAHPNSASPVFYWTANQNLSNDGLTVTQDDVTKSSWQTYMNLGTDTFVVRRAPAGSTTFASLLTLDATGSLTASGTSFKLGPRGVFTANAAFTQLTVNDATSPTYDRNGSPSWYISAVSTSDAVFFYRRAPNTDTQVDEFHVDNVGNLVIAGGTAVKVGGGTWTAPSDPRLKNDIAPYPRGLADILPLEPITYRLKAFADGPTYYGFDAAKVRDVFPECVSEMRMKLEPEDEEETDGVLTFDMHPILVALVNAVKELAARVDAR